MRLVTRYLLKAFLGPLFVCLVAFNGIYIIFDLFGSLSKFLDAKIDFLTVLKYYGGIISMYSHWFIPASCMLATLYAMWQLSHHNELTAMRASGISFHRLTLPFFSVAVAMSLLTFFNSEFVAPEASAWSEEFKEASFDSGDTMLQANHLYVNQKARRNWIFSSVDIRSENGFAHPVGKVEIKEERDGVNVRGVRAEKAEFLDGMWWLTSPTEIRFDADGVEVPVSPDAAKLPALMSVPGFDETPRDMLLEVRDWEFFSLADMLRYLQIRGIHATDKNGSEKWYEFWYRIFSPWACVVITIFAIPAGISTGRQSVIRGVIMALALFFSFYAGTLLLKFLAGQEAVISPFVAALAPNLIFLVFGVAMYRKLT